MIHLENISVHFGEDKNRFAAVDDVSLSIPAGKIHGIIGFSGAGKSSLIRVINLLNRPSQGSVRVGGVELTTLTPNELRRQRHHIGMIFQHFNLLGNQTALQNVELSLRFSGTPKGKRRQKALEALAIVDLADKANQYPAQLSGGQKQRVAIARAIVTEPSVLLCDEPTSAVDPRTTDSVLQYLSDINLDLGITTVLVTHEMNVIKALADDVSIMESGRIVETLEKDQLQRPGFTPTTEIGRYLVSDEITIDRRTNAPVPELSHV